ncbi:hypothetical protein [Phenylobacterium sp.]|uniref:hypothetical protein n=1 Tax=Phenylobacterium sp. TaxID=1871053 RepID=UPI0027321F0E|nr:hypothetical protein [Phenylobacterium sp.]MDP1873605.1 hypothetical protein [Phenylobacterium sp.]
MSVVLPFPAPPLRLARPTDDAVLVFHDGKALRFDSPAAMRRAVMDAELPEIRAALTALEDRAAELQAQAQAASNAALSLSRDLKAEREANAVRLRALIADQERLRAHAVRDWSCAAFALGLVVAAVLFGA